MSKKQWKPSVVPTAADGFSPADLLLYERLSAVRREFAQRENKAAFKVFHNSHLKEMVRRRPTTLDQFRAIGGGAQAVTGLAVNVRL